MTCAFLIFVFVTLIAIFSHLILYEIQVWLKRLGRFSLLMSFLRVSGEAGRRVCLTHGRGELRSRREKRRRMVLKI